MANERDHRVFRIEPLDRPSRKPLDQEDLLRRISRTSTGGILQLGPMVWFLRRPIAINKTIEIVGTTGNRGELLSTILMDHGVRITVSAPGVVFKNIYFKLKDRFSRSDFVVAK